MVMVCCLSVLVEKVCSRSRRAGQCVKEQFDILKERAHREAEQMQKVSLNLLGAKQGSGDVSMARWDAAQAAYVVCFSECTRELFQ